LERTWTAKHANQRNTSSGSFRYFIGGQENVPTLEGEWWGMLNDRVADHPLLLSLDEARSGYSVKLVQLEGAVIVLVQREME
jgi:hypothetical protein